MKSKGHIVNKNLSFVIPGIGVLWLPDTYIFLKNVKLYMISRSEGQITSLHVTVWRWTPNNFLENLSKESMTKRKFGFLSKKKLMVEKNSGSHKTLNWQKIYELGVFFLFFFVVVEN